MGRFVKNVLPTVEQLAWAAGFFDGEGTIRICKHSKRSRCFTLQVSAVQATEYPLDLFLRWFGGTLAKRMLKYRGGKRVQFTWQASNAKAGDFLRLVLPYLRVKRDEALVALRYRKIIRDQTLPNTRVKLTDKEVTARLHLKLRLEEIRKEKRALAYEAGG